MNRVFLFLGLLFPLSAFALGMDVTADIPSGTYHAPIHITLTPSEPLAKTFYSFKPDGTPNDAFLYTGSILLKHSTPFIYFSFLTTDNESKIKQNNYIFEYPGSVQFQSDSLSGSGDIEVTLVNKGTESVDIGWWYVQSEIDRVMIPEGTLLTAGARYSLKISYSGSSAIVLRSPDDEEKDVLLVQSPLSNSLVPTKTVTVKVVPRKIISTVDTPKNTTKAVLPSAVSAPIASESPTSPSRVESEFSPTDNTIIQSPVPTTDINKMVKVSLVESDEKNMNPLYLFGLLLASFAIGGFQWYMRKRQK